MTFMPGKIRTVLSEDAYRDRTSNTFCKERKGGGVQYHVYGQSMAVGFSAKHLAS